MMVEEVFEGNYEDKFFGDINTRIRDLEEKQRLLRDRMFLISDSFVKVREKNFDEIQNMKKDIEILKMENLRLKEIVLRLGDVLDKSARKEELMLLQRQFDLFRDK